MGTLGLDLAVGTAVGVGVVGVVVPVLPGLLLVWAAVLVWALATGGGGPWAVFAAVTALAAAGEVIKYVLPGRRMRAAGIPGRTLVAGAALGVVGFFVVPVVGAIPGFVGGVYLAERARLGAHGDAWPSTKAALRGALLSVLIEFAAAAACAGVWLVGAVANA